ncbi:hypothetical protein [Streptomyces sp. NPDC050388]|uniref:hypothetical protein n=1 Tax=Streptomyces sp. NPDC050388 TaxID=3155781 RepID=UPI003421D3F5
MTSDLWTTDFRVVPYVTRPGAPVSTRATYVVENGRPGVQLDSEGPAVRPASWGQYRAGRAVPEDADARPGS